MHWSRMSPQEQETQIRYACGVFYSVAERLAKFDSSRIKWHGSTGIYNNTKIKVGFAGGCKVTTACIAGSPCLESMVADHRKVAR
jgi:hypothetical protein